MLLTLDRPQIHRPNMTQKVPHTQYATATQQPSVLFLSLHPTNDTIRSKFITAQVSGIKNVCNLVWMNVFGRTSVISGLALKPILAVLLKQH